MVLIKKQIPRSCELLLNTSPGGRGGAVRNLAFRFIASSPGNANVKPVFGGWFIFLLVCVPLQFLADDPSYHFASARSPSADLEWKQA